MGKLHSLKRAIQRDPEKFIIRSRWHKRVWLCGAEQIKSTGEWRAVHGSRSHQGFIYRTLSDMGYT